jgi:hypothetical protein
LNDSLPKPWQELADELNLDIRPCEPPEEASGSWFDLQRHFGDAGFLRLLASPDDTATTLRLEVAPPAEELGADWVQSVASSLETRCGTGWQLQGDGPPWTLNGSLEAEAQREELTNLLQDVDALGAHVSSPETNQAPDWLRTDTPSADAPERGSEESGDAVFESIGDGDSESQISQDPSDGLSGHGGDARLDEAVVRETDGGLEARITLDRQVSTPELETLGRGLAHTLRARFGVTANPRPVEEPAGGDRGPSTLVIRIAEMDADHAAAFDPGEIADRLEDYFERLERFGGHGLTLADVLGLGSETDDRETRSTDADDSDEQDGVVLDLDRDTRTEQTAPPEDDASDETVLQGADAGLKAGNYTDPRLMRDDADTALVDVVLRHPGYAERRMAHNLGILLDVDFTDAMELVQDAPCLIAWGVGRERGQRFKRVIENAGGKVVLVEPETFTPAE